MGGKCNDKVAGPGWLYGWKDIAGHVGCTIKTARGYVSAFRMPIHRLPNRKPMALREELDEWVKKAKKGMKDGEDELE